MHATRKKRLVLALGIFALVSFGVALIVYGLRQNIDLFYDLAAVHSHNAPLAKPIRVGGLVMNGKVVRKTALETEFVITDAAQHTLLVTYQGVLPDLFREGQGVIARGQLVNYDQFVASEVLTKHDETYMPPELVESLKAKGEFTPK